jgi:hypothetical protein
VKFAGKLPARETPVVALVSLPLTEIDGVIWADAAATRARTMAIAARLILIM